MVGNAWSHCLYVNHRMCPHPCRLSHMHADPTQLQNPASSTASAMNFKATLPPLHKYGMHVRAALWGVHATQLTSRAPLLQHKQRRWWCSSFHCPSGGHLQPAKAVYADAKRAPRSSSWAGGDHHSQAETQRCRSKKAKVTNHGV